LEKKSPRFTFQIQKQEQDVGGGGGASFREPPNEEGTLNSQKEKNLESGVQRGKAEKLIKEKRIKFISGRTGTKIPPNVEEGGITENLSHFVECGRDHHLGWRRGREGLRQGSNFARGGLRCPGNL